MFYTHCSKFYFVSYFLSYVHILNPCRLPAVFMIQHSQCTAVITARQRICGKVMFSYVSVHQSVCPQAGSLHVAITHDALELTVHDLTPPPSPALPHHRHDTSTPFQPGLHLLLMTFSDHHWRPVQTFSLGLTVQAPLPGCDI